MRPEGPDAFAQGFAHAFTHPRTLERDFACHTHHILQYGKEQIILAAKVVAQGCLVQTRFRCDFSGRGFCETIPRQHANSRRDDLRSSLNSRIRPGHFRPLLSQRGLYSSA